MKFLEKNNVRRINPMGEKFNPSEHEAVSQVQQDGVESGTVIQVLSGGYALSERVIKPAIVVVAA
jgi:molecular chaperone GrpE